MHTLKAMALAIGSGLVMLPGAWAANSLQVVCASDKGGECYASFAYDTTAWNFGRDARFEWEGRNIVMTPARRARQGRVLRRREHQRD